MNNFEFNYDATIEADRISCDPQERPTCDECGARLRRGECPNEECPINNPEPFQE